MKALLIPALSLGLLFGPVCPMAAMAAMPHEHVSRSANMSVAERFHSPEHACCKNHSSIPSTIVERKDVETISSHASIPTAQENQLFHTELNAIREISHASPHAHFKQRRVVQRE